MTNTWRQFGQYEASGGLLWWPKVGEPSKLHGAMRGLRSDGQRFFIIMEIAADKIYDLETHQRVICEAHEKLQTCLNCACANGVYCAAHKPQELAA